ATNVSSRKRRRSPGPPFTSARSSGANTLTRNAPRRSRARCSRCRLTCTRLRPPLTISASSRSSRPSRSPSARTTAAAAPSRMRASGGAPRNDDNVARYASASRRFVLPSPLAPSTTVSPGANSTSAEGYDRKSVSQSRLTSNSRHADGHEQVQEVVALRGADDGGLQGVERGDDDLVARCHVDAVEEVLGVERHGELGALVLRVELLVRLAHVLGDRHQLEPVSAHHHAHRRRFTRHEFDAPH